MSPPTPEVCFAFKYQSLYLQRMHVSGLKSQNTKNMRFNKAVLSTSLPTPGWISWRWPLLALYLPNFKEKCLHGYLFILLSIIHRLSGMKIVLSIYRPFAFPLPFFQSVAIFVTSLFIVYILFLTPRPICYWANYISSFIYVFLKIFLELIISSFFLYLIFYSCIPNSSCLILQHSILHLSMLFSTQTHRGFIS